MQNQLTRQLSERVKAVEISAIRQMPILAKKVPGAISLSQGIPDIKTPKYIRDSVIKFLESDAAIGKYSLQPGMPELKQAIAQKLLGQSNWKVDAEKQICVTAGAMEALAIAIAAVVDADDEVLVFDPGYASYCEQIILAGGKPVNVALDFAGGWQINRELLKQALTEKTKAIVVCNPSNPTGTVLSQSDVDFICELALEKGLFLIGDLTYEFLVYDNKPLATFFGNEKISDRLILCYSFSKEFSMTGWRVGYLFAPERVMEQAMKVHDAFVICAPTISQYAALAALTEKPERGLEFKSLSEKSISTAIPEFRLQNPQKCSPIPWHRLRFFRIFRSKFWNFATKATFQTGSEVKADLSKKRQIICERLDKLTDLFEYRKPEGAYYILAKYKKTNLNSWDFAMKMLNEAKVACVPGVAFGQNGEGFVRFSFGASMENINEAFNRIEEWNKTI